MRRHPTSAAASFSGRFQNSLSKNGSPGLNDGDRRCNKLALLRWRGRGVMSHGSAGTLPTRGTMPLGSGSAFGYLDEEPRW